MKKRIPTPDRLWAKVDKNGPPPGAATLAAGKGPCWLWTASVNRNGYGLISCPERECRIAVHRLAYELLVGPIPAGFQLDHLCRVPACVNPEHLEPVTSRENTLRGIGISAANAVKTHCVNGHPFDEENTAWTPQGDRRCRACYRDYLTARRRRLGVPEKSKTHCKRGHEFTPDNTYRASGGGRGCRTCRKEWHRATRLTVLREEAS